MKIEDAERFARWVCAAGALLFTSVVVTGIARGSHRARGRATGSGRYVTRGSPAFFIPASIVGIWLVGLMWRPIPLLLSPAARVAALVTGSIMFLTGLATMLWGRLTLGRMYGVSTGLGAELYADHQLVTAGPFAFVRHPIYLGAQLAEIGALLIYRNWAVLAISLQALTLVMRARREEGLLAAQFGASWDEYKSRVPFLYPRIARAGR
jgi:protein-S-isoprenylcysteine O-methyltransferase Ste14